MQCLRGVVFKKSFSRTLPSFINFISTGSSDVAQSLALLQQQSGLYESPEAEIPDDEIANSLNSITFQQSLVDAPLVVTRAALYVFLNAMVRIKIKLEALLTIEACWPPYLR